MIKPIVPRMDVQNHDKDEQGKLFPDNSKPDKAVSLDSQVRRVESEQRTEKEPARTSITAYLTKSEFAHVMGVKESMVDWYTDVIGLTHFDYQREKYHINELVKAIHFEADRQAKLKPKKRIYQKKFSGTGFDYTVRKPDMEAILMTSKMLGLTPEASLHFESNKGAGHIGEERIVAEAKGPLVSLRFEYTGKISTDSKKEYESDFHQKLETECNRLGITYKK